MALLILGVIALAIVIFLAEAGILAWVEKLFKIENPTYKNSVKTLIFSGIAGAVVGIIFSIINLGLLSNIIVTAASFFAFHYFLKKYYLIYVFEPFFVSGEAMSPTYNNGDYLLINKFDKNFARSDVVILRTKKQPSSFLIKRIIGLPSEKVDIQGGKILINGQALNESYYSGETLPDSSFT